MPTISSQNHEQYSYIEVPKGAILNKEMLEELSDQVQQSRQQKKKTLISLPPHYNIEQQQQSDFFQLLKQSIKSGSVIVPQQGLKWSWAWHKIVDAGFPVVEYHKALLWATGQSIPSGIDMQQIDSTVYLRCAGNIDRHIDDLAKMMKKILAGLPLKGEITSSPQTVATEHGQIWTYLRQALIIDVANVFLLRKNFFQTLLDIFKKYKLAANAPGLYFVTSGVFQTWMLKHCLDVDNINEIGNVIRVMPDNDKNYDKIVRHEVKALNKQCQQLSPSPVLLIHQVQGADRAGKVIRRFYPDIVIVDAISDATYLKEKLPVGIQEKVYHVTPANNADLMILGPQLITQGYDLQLFGEYLISRYRNYHGHPNDTYIYYLNTRPESLKKATSFFMYEFDQILGDSERPVLDRLVKCETEAEEQGSFVISLLENSILRLDIDLPLTAGGSSTFLSSYPELFPHHFAELCGSLRLFLKGESADALTQVNIHLVDDFNEFTIKQPGFWIEVRLEEKQSILTIKSDPDEKLEKRCFSIFALLNASNIFNRLPDKEILIEIISLLWENYSHSRVQQGFLITLIASAHGSDLKVFQSENNRIMLKEAGEDGQLNLQFIGSFPYQRNIQRRLMKLLSLFFTVSQEDSQENTWRFGCFEAASQTFANGQSENTVNVNFSIQGDRWSAQFLSDTREPYIMPDRSRQTIEAGAQKVYISPIGREIKLIRNPTPEDLEEREPEVTLEKELQNLEANAILQQVEDEKSKEAAARSLRLQSLYDSALKAHNKKYGFDEDEIAAEEKKGKSLEEALRIKMYQRKRPDQTRLKKNQTDHPGDSSRGDVDRYDHVLLPVQYDCQARLQPRAAAFRHELSHLCSSTSKA